jgi:uncharacterized membrane protein
MLVSLQTTKPAARRQNSANWFRFNWRDEEDGGCHSLILWSHQKPYVIASVLSPLGRAALADALEAGMRQRSGNAA